MFSIFSGLGTLLPGIIFSITLPPLKKTFDKFLKISL